MNQLLGKTLQDKVTGFAGVVTARIEYLYGEAQVQVERNGESHESQWFPESRIVGTASA